MRITAKAGRIVTEEHISFQFYENRRSREPDGSLRTRKKLEFYPPYFRKSIQDALSSWRLPNRELTFDVTFKFELGDENGGLHDKTRLEAVIEYQNVGPENSQSSVPGLVSVRVTRLGPEQHIDSVEVPKRD